ncbi:MAG: helix-turn-helix domain-containing protein [Candidatus Helarchaeota archaeon]
MKQITIQITGEIPIELMEIIGFKSIFKYIERVEVLHIFRYDNYNLIAIQKFKFRDGYSPKDLLKIEEFGIKFIEELVRIDDQYICFVKTKKKNKFHDLMSDFDMLLHYPIIFEQNYLKLSVISHETQLKSVIDFFTFHINKENFKILSIMPLKNNINSIFSVLSERQFEIIRYAVKKGYYRIPREISANKIAKKFNISVQALHEHIRKAERKILETLFSSID